MKTILAILILAISSFAQTVDETVVEITAPTMTVQAAQLFEMQFTAVKAGKSQRASFAFQYDPEVIAIAGCWVDGTIASHGRVINCERMSENSFYISIQSPREFEGDGVLVRVKGDALGQGTSPIRIWGASMFGHKELISTVAESGMVSVQ